MCSSVFIVEDIESRQADVRDFFLTESNYRCRVLRRCIACRTNGCHGCARQRQRPSDSQYRYGFRSTTSLRSLLRVQHGKTSHLNSDGRGLSGNEWPRPGLGAIEGAGTTGNAKQRGAPLVQSLERDRSSYV